METKFTKGEWMIAQNKVEDKIQFTVLSNATKVICDVYRHNYPGKKSKNEPLSEANAKLIAAAPELLEALDKCAKLLRLIARHNNLPDIDAVVTYAIRAEAAIKKASE